MSFPRYPEYKDSGVKWLGEVPAHWEVLPCRAIVHERTAKNEGATCQDYLSLMANVGIIPYAEKGDVGNKKPEDLSKCKMVAQGDFVINSMNYGIGSYGLSDYDGVCSPVYIVLKPQGCVVESRFAYRVFENRAFQTYAQSFGNGILEHRCAINWDILKPIGVGVPPIDEQKTILAFLDRETAKIDALVTEQRRLIELLKEKRQAVISHAVTKGLNPAAPMKPSGIEWLGDVPAHWEVKPLKYSITKIEQGWSPQCWSEPAAEDEWGVLKVGCVNREQFDYNEQKRLPLELEPQPIYEIKPRDILMSRGNTLELVGSATFVAEVRPRLLLSDLLYRFRAKPERVEGEFLVLSLRSPNVRYQIERDATGTSPSMKKIGQGIIREFVIAIPPLSEQHEIIAFIKDETAKLDTLTTEAQRAIDLFQERRSALISAAVTGQIDVRAAM
ncbi:MAG: restriction endonuclease subunit S [Acidithiobacillus sp.]